MLSTSSPLERSLARPVGREPEVCITCGRARFPSSGSATSSYDTNAGRGCASLGCDGSAAADRDARHVFQGFPPGDVMRTLGLSPAAFRSALARGALRLLPDGSVDPNSFADLMAGTSL